ncbi:hypothetical protein COU74_02510 [Candidatus Peregrinibacteria bacterium CG10_big_fil_rev_8_21_14_0_10_36_19]|nr:MAG: hypothetical protein COU74_02510 [Candidatus Peregrinibacteria bacterium CG10_big_fil_rev_8_21_14_0_10_36_19]
MKKVEVHIAAPELDGEKTEVLKLILAQVGIPKTKHFHKVADYKPITEGCANGHDISNPGTMSTVKVESHREAITLVKNAMQKLRAAGIEGANFEIEQVILPGADDEIKLDTSELGEFSQVPNSPQSENHILYKGTLDSIPTDAEIINMARSIGLEVNQVVDFGYEKTPNKDSVVSRVATFYQPTNKDSMIADQILRDNLDKLRNPRVVTEQVLMVGEFVKDALKD